MQKTLKPLTPPASTYIHYRVGMQKLIKAMVRDYASLLGLYRDKRHQVAMDDNAWFSTEVQARLHRLGTDWQRRFNEYAESAAPDFVQLLLKQTDLQLKMSLSSIFATERFTLFGTPIPQALKQILKINVQENVELIKSIPRRFHRRIQTDLTNVVNGSGTFRDLQKTIANSGGITMREAKVIAKDQTNKVFNAIAIRRMEQVGVTKVKWLHSGAVKTPRPYHIRKWDGKSGTKDMHPNGLNGFVFNINERPVINEKTGDTGLPGEEINCSCKIVPVMEI